MDSQTLNVGLIGYGLGGATFHAPFITRTPGLHLATVMTSDPARQAAVRERYPDAGIAASLDDLLATKPDLVAISSPNASHYPLAKAALEAGAHVVVDKPFAATAAQARELGALATRVGRIAIPFQNRRWDGDYLTLRRLIDDGMLGDVHLFQSRFDRWRPIRKPGWCRPDAAALAENIVHDLGTHLIDQALQLFGPVTRVYAELRAIDPTVVTFDDMFISLAHANGVQSHLGSSMAAAIFAPRYNVLGTKGAYVKEGVDPQEGILRAGGSPDSPGYGEEPEELWGIYGNGERQERVRTVTGNYSPFYAGVARAILNGDPPPVTVEQVAEGLDIIGAAFASAAKGETVAM
ncbi:MAG: Gfo/Idh/MocA family oxidoreductase [bacterium]